MISTRLGRAHNSIEQARPVDCVDLSRHSRVDGVSRNLNLVNLLPGSYILHPHTIITHRRRAHQCSSYVCRQFWNLDLAGEGHTSALPMSASSVVPCWSWILQAKSTPVLLLCLSSVLEPGSCRRRAHQCSSYVCLVGDSMLGQAKSIPVLRLCLSLVLEPGSRRRRAYQYFFLCLPSGIRLLQAKNEYECPKSATKDQAQIGNALCLMCILLGCY
jgi:hypothetical protein